MHFPHYRRHFVFLCDVMGAVELFPPVELSEYKIRIMTEDLGADDEEADVAERNKNLSAVIALDHAYFDQPGESHYVDVNFEGIREPEGMAFEVRN